ncbi:MAG: hypothetical protein H6Q72_798 [Firmicutes bacterium]|nr:hypothetical protein [Bacillota bacterium]
MADATQQTIINTILGDIIGVIPNFSSLVSSYRLLVGAAEEVRRTPGVPFEIFERAVIRFDRTGTLIDILLEVLCCKIAFSSQFLAVTCAPVDIIRLLANCNSLNDKSFQTAEQIIILEALRQLLDNNCQSSCFGPPPEGITPPVPPPLPKPVPPPIKPPCPPGFIQSDLESTKELETEVTPPVTTRSQKYASPLRRRHI